MKDKIVEMELTKSPAKDSSMQSLQKQYSALQRQVHEMEVGVLPEEKKEKKRKEKKRKITPPNKENYTKINSC